MAAFYNIPDLEKINRYHLVIDTNIVALCSSDEIFLQSFLEIFKKSNRLLDPIIKLEFLRGTQTDSLYKKKLKFLEFHEFYDMPDHYEIYNKVKDDTYNIARIYSHHKNPDIPLGDLFITSRLKYYSDTHLLITLDQQDFSTLLFDRLAVVSIETSPIKTDRKSTSLMHIVVLQFNKEKYEECLNKLNKF